MRTADAPVLADVARPVEVERGLGVACRLWQLVWSALMVEYWAGNWLRPAGWRLDAIERGEWYAPHVSVSIATWVVVAGYLLWQMVRRRVWPFMPLGRSTSVTLFVVYVALALASAAYSTIPSLSIVWAVKLVLALGLIGVYVRRFHRTYCWRPAVNATAMTLVAALAASIALAFISPDWIVLTSGEALARLGTIDHPVRLGLAAAVAVLLVGVWVPAMGARLLNSLLFRWSVIGLGVAIIGLTLSRTGLFVAAIAGATALVVTKHRARAIGGLVYPVLVLLPLIGLLWGPDAIGGIVERFVYRYDRVATYQLTGRFDVWEESLDLVRRAPWFGYGFVASTRTELAPRLGWWMPAHAHNTWLQAALDVGLVGAAFLLASSIGFVWLALAGLRGRSGRNTLGEVCGCQTAAAVIIIALATASFHETVFAGTPTVLTLLWLLGGAVVGIGRSCDHDKKVAA